MNRRFFIKSAMAGVIAASPLMQFAKAAPSNILKGYQSPPDAGFARKSMRLVAGDVPKGFRGTYFLNGPAKHERGGERYEHWFDGDGMVHAFRFGDEGATHEGRFVETPKFVEEREAGRFLYPTFGTIPENPKPALSSDTINAANISVLPVGDQIWALWEGGSPTALRPDDLSTEGFVTLGEGLTGVPVSAHPRVDTDGVIWSFGNAAMTGQLLLYKIMPDGSLAKFKVLNDLDIVSISNNLGDAKSLITHPATTTHQRLTDEERAEMGITDGMVRLSVGLENAGDLIADLESAFGKLA